MSLLPHLQVSPKDTPVDWGEEGKEKDALQKGVLR